MELRLRIGAILRQQKMTTSQLAERAGISRTTANALAGGFQRRVDFEVIRRVADALGVRPLELFEEVEPDANSR
jgi:transcriptional regulator with XRE-family HTH domain